ncbi:MAG: peptidoglycan recognition family protein [Sporomusaceae bacterium]|nr:peptidoglycan recognition family protein [Sporomusaceae bacterium]
MMNRRTFLKRSLYSCSVLWFGQNIVDACSALAQELPPPPKKPANINNVQWSTTNVKQGQQVYFQTTIDLTGNVEIIKTETADSLFFLIKNCHAEKFIKSFACRNVFVSTLDIKEIAKKDTQLRLKIADPSLAPEVRYTLAEQPGNTRLYRLTIQVGTFSRPKALKERDLAILETAFAFGPLDTRPATDLIVIHHVGLVDEDVSAAKIHEWHLANGWSGIGYHYVIRKNGRIERGRPRDTVGAHAYGFNKTSIGINLVGNFEDVEPKEAQIKTAAKLIAALCNLYNFSPDDTSVVGHRDLNDTLCPGKNLYVQMGDLREQAAKLMKIN